MSANHRNLPSYPRSPVPSDEHLACGELPFTAFGQFGEGKMDNRVFDQDIYWVNIAGKAFLIEEMSSDYRRNVIDFLRENCEYFHARAALRTGIEALILAFEGRVHGDILARDLGSPAIEDLDPLDWLESTPLMRKLKSLGYNCSSR